MANPSLLTCEVIDALGVTTSHTIFINPPAATTITQLQTFANDYAGVLDSIIDGQITALTAKITLTLPGTIKTSPVAGSEVERTGLFNMSQSGSKYKQGVDVPTLAAAVIVNGKIDLTNAQVLAYLAFLEAVTVGISVVSKFVNSLTGLVDALITFRKHRKLENRRSFEV